MRLNRNIIVVFSGSLLFQIVQIGTYPILLAQILSANALDTFIIGCFLAISWVVVLLLGPAVPKIIQRLGAAHANGIAFVLTSASLVLLIFFENLVGIFVSALGMGAGLIIRWINCDALIVNLSNYDARGRIIGLHEALMGLGIGLGPLLFTVLALEDVAKACLGLIALGQTAFYLARTNDAANTEEIEQTEGVPFRYGMILLLLVAAFVAGFIENAAIALLPLYFESFGYSLAAGVLLVSSFGFGGTLLQPPLGYLADKTSYRFAQNLCVVTIAATCLVIMAFSDNAVISFIALFLLGGTAGGLNT